MDVCTEYGIVYAQPRGRPAVVKHGRTPIDTGQLHRVDIQYYSASKKYFLGEFIKCLNVHIIILQ